MPITIVNGVITETEIKKPLRSLKTGVFIDSDFAVCDENNLLKQLKFDVSNIASEATRVLTVPNRDLNLGAAAAQALQYAAPLAAATVVVAAATTMLVIEPAGTIATLTVTLPATPADGTRIGLSFVAEVTALTLASAGADTFVSAITAGSAGQVSALVYRASTAKWYRAP